MWSCLNLDKSIESLLRFDHVYYLYFLFHFLSINPFQMPNIEKKYFLIIDNNVMKTFQNHIHSVDISQYSRTKCLICWISTVSQIPPFFHRHWPLWWSDWKHSTWWPWEFCPHWRSQGYCLLGLEPEKWRIYYKLQSLRSTPLNKHIFSWDGKTATSPQ